MTDEQAVRLILARAEGCDRVILVYPKGDQSACAWYGMTPEQAAEHLYQVADEIVKQRVPMKGVDH